ncbi:conserved oligomeric Golgi complex subunit 8-like [Argonauta hians]
MSTIDVEDETILTAIFKDSFPESWKDNPDFVQYLAELSSYGIEKLSREPDRLAEEKAQILEETQDLAFHNYKTFIETAECSREIFEDFQIIEKHVSNLLQQLPPFSCECENIAKRAQEINASRRMNSLTLQRHTQLLEILEMPQLMDTCVRNGYYEEALELTAHVKRLEKKHYNLQVIANIVDEVKGSTQLMLNQLIQQLRTNIQLPLCLRVIGYLRRMDVFSEPELRIKFLQARDAWFQWILDGIPTEDAYVHITKVIEASRVHLFDIITQYRAIFSDDDTLLPSTPSASDGLFHLQHSSPFYSWLTLKVNQFLTSLKCDLSQGIGGRLDSLLGQCMYFSLSFSRIGADFRGLLVPIFHEAALNSFQVTLSNANTKFSEMMQSYNLMGLTLTGGLAYSMSTQPGQLYPPSVLLDFQPLANYCNYVLTAFNDLRLCLPITLASSISTQLHKSLLEVNDVILAFHRAEESTLSPTESDHFQRMLQVYTKHLLPYLHRCISTLFPPAQLVTMLGITVSDLAALGNPGSLNIESIQAGVSHLFLDNDDDADDAAAPAADSVVETERNLFAAEDSSVETVVAAPAMENVPEDCEDSGQNKEVQPQVVGASDSSSDTTLSPIPTEVAIPTDKDSTDVPLPAATPTGIIPTEASDVPSPVATGIIPTDTSDVPSPVATGIIPTETSDIPSFATTGIIPTEASDIPSPMATGIIPTDTSSVPSPMATPTDSDIIPPPTAELLASVPGAVTPASGIIPLNNDTDTIPSPTETGVIPPDMASSSSATEPLACEPSVKEGANLGPTSVSELTIDLDDIKLD